MINEGMLFSLVCCVVCVLGCVVLCCVCMCVCVQLMVVVRFKHQDLVVGNALEKVFLFGMDRSTGCLLLLGGLWMEAQWSLDLLPPRVCWRWKQKLLQFFIGKLQ